MPPPTGKITLGRYMWERLHQVGINTIFGVPGDFNLQFLDYIFHVDGLNWAGNQNELNAAYAADGYARVKGVPGCLVTTHGVGELSALNGIAGAMSEQVKIIHVVGQTTRGMQKHHMMIHHSIGDKPDHQQYNRASVGLRYAAAELWDVKTAPKEIDRVIRECFIKSGPVYIFLPLDLSAEEVDASLLDTPIDVHPHVDEKAQEEAVRAITSAISEAQQPTILVDALVQRFGAEQETRQVVKKLNVPFFSANMGKGIVDETEETYVGVWNGEVSSPGVKEVAKAADLVITLGYIPADTNSAAFSRKLEVERTIHVNPFDVVVKGKTYPNISIKPLLAALFEALPSTPKHQISKPQLPPLRTPLDQDATHLTQSFLWPQIEAFIRPADIIVSETGTSNFGLCDITFPMNIRFITQIYYGSIGFATAATLGVEVARREQEQEMKQPGRTILFTGDGSMALTIQEIGTMIKAGIKPILFVINNEGYTIERLIWGAKQPYNDIVPTNYKHLLPLYHHPSPETSFHRATTKEELTAVLAKPELQNPTHLQLVELVMDKLDTSWKLGTLLAWRSEEHKEYLTREGFVDTYGGWGLDGKAGGDVKWS
ncbi:pyruvate decarboxylase-like protein [Cucurbitaria berberidis CBS 394.84]|uniref:Pyruvate decarboxylase n=1 Tax=Cucurbitaria berberidis CBS 394.84 TaxID=1168544 RepID=A0A9P4L624_9PLEO|nr:pyruvate decarboxylase-like protein [Cucurbitaria berberidis CBS 394.84]KAF1842854.1 pyruvate decarboxylase-like protein [Cucurbitaria berberidis CBS 394.84]